MDYLIGYKRGSLTVLSVRSGNKRSLCKCLCECGRRHTISSRKFLLDEPYICNLIKTESIISDLKIVKVELPKVSQNLKIDKRKNKKLSKYHQLIVKYRKDATKRGLEFLIDDFLCISLFCGFCYYCGMISSNTFNNLKYNGIDRIDNSIGYIDTNVISCCKYCNSMKSDMSYNKFIEHIQSINKNTILPY